MNRPRTRLLWRHRLGSDAHRRDLSLPHVIPTSIDRLASNVATRLRERQQLAEMDDRSLRDIGRTRYDIECELRKPFWRE
jgi:uncharacterized protein YjiS (DUF1127 family)